MISVFVKERYFSLVSMSQRVAASLVLEEQGTIKHSKHRSVN